MTRGSCLTHVVRCVESLSTVATSAAFFVTPVSWCSTHLSWVIMVVVVVVAAAAAAAAVAARLTNLEISAC